MYQRHANTHEDADRDADQHADPDSYVDEHADAHAWGQRLLPVFMLGRLRNVPRAVFRKLLELRDGLQRLLYGRRKWLPWCVRDAHAIAYVNPRRAANENPNPDPCAYHLNV